MAYLTRQVNGVRTYTDIDRRIKSINARLGRIYDTLGESSETAARVENVIVKELKTKMFGTDPHGKRVQVETSKTKGTRMRLSRSNRDYERINTIDLEIALDAIEDALNKNSIANERKKLVSSLRNAGIQPNQQAIFGKARNTYSYSQLKNISNLRRNADTYIDEAIKFFYNVNEMDRAGMIDVNGNPFNPNPEKDRAWSILHKSHKTQDEISEVLELANRLEARMTAADVRTLQTPNTPWESYHNPNSSAYAGSLWEAWDKV